MQKSKIKNPRLASISGGQEKLKNKIFKNFIFLIIVLIFEFWVFNLICAASDIIFEATVDKNKISFGGNIKLSLIFHNTQDVPKPELPQMKNVRIRYIGPSAMMSMVNGKTARSITYNYIITPLKPGVLSLGPFSVSYKGKTYTSGQITVEVVRGSVTEKKQAPQTPAKIKMDLENRIFVVMEIEKEKLYLNEVVPLTIKLYVNRLSLREIQYPQFEHEGFSVGEFEKPRQYTQGLNGISYDVVEFRTHIFAIKPGELTLGPSELECNLIVREQRVTRKSSIFDDFFGGDAFDDFFGKYETYPLELKSKEISVTVLPLPKEGRPENFSGAVGNFNFNLLIEPKAVEVGDPMTLKMIVTGRGNFDVMRCPASDLREDFKIYEPQVTLKGNKKTFEQVLIPKTEEIKEIPRTHFSFFDPIKGTYQTISRGPLPIEVTKRKKEEKAKIVESLEKRVSFPEDEILGKDIVYIKELPGKMKRKGVYLYKNRGFLLLQLLPFLFLISVLTIYKRSEKLKTDTRYARRLYASKKAREGIKKAQRFLSEEKRQEFYDAIFKTLQEYLGDKLHLPAGGITIDVVDEILKPRGIDEDTLSKLRDIFKDCDMARYAPSEFGKSQMEVTFKNIEEILRFLERHRL